MYDAPVDYDTVDNYPTKPFRICRIDRMEALARLMGLDPVASTAARVLEIGGGTGGNLMPMAEAFPGSRFVCVDLSGDQIARGERVRQAAGLANVQLIAMNLMDIDASFGEFDYIIAHGVYSWVPPAVKARLLDVLSERLSPRGIAYASYNVKPGWYRRAAMRDMMLYHTRAYDTQSEKVKHGRSLLDFLAAGARDNELAWKDVLGQHAEVMHRMSEAEVTVDFLGDINDALYFHEMAAQIGQRGLTYLCDIPFSAMVPDHIPPDALGALEKLGDDVIRREQYLDFLKNRPFRASLMVRAGAPITRNLELKRMLDWNIGSRAEIEEAKPDIEGTDAVTYRVGKGKADVTTVPTKRAMGAITAASPGSLKLSEVVAAAGPDAARVAVELFQLFSYDIVDLWPYPDPFVVEPGEKPRATGLSRAMSTLGPRVTNLRHEAVDLDDAERALLPLLDGTRAQAELPGKDVKSVLAGIGKKALLVPA